MPEASEGQWTVEDALSTYNIERWGGGYYSINESGNVCVRPKQGGNSTIDLYQLVQDIQKRGIQLPLLLRFTDVLGHRVQEISAAFAKSIQDADYKGKYFCVYPIKVNQESHLVEEYFRYARPLGFGLEAGSKPELMVVLAVTAGKERSPIICNGFKDEEYLRLVILAQKLGKKIIPVVEQYHELGMILKYAEELGVKPEIGLRVKLAARGAGRWQNSAGQGSKFGLTVSQAVAAIEELKSKGKEKSLTLLHFHLGSQITNIQNIKTAVTEAARIYAELYKKGAGMRYLNIGGGLGVDYDGSQTDFESSTNYNLQQYANDVVHRIMTVCDDSNIPHPTIISESGRAIMSYSTVLVYEALSSIHSDSLAVTGNPPEDAPQPVIDLYDTLRDLDSRDIMETYQDLLKAQEEAHHLFNLGHLSLELRGKCDQLAGEIQSRLLQKNELFGVCSRRTSRAK